MASHFGTLPIAEILLLPTAVAANTIVHELGHAAAALLFSRKKVTVRIGSYREVPNAIALRSKWIDISFTRNPLAWARGICIPSEPAMSARAWIVVTLAGPLGALLVGMLGVAAFYLVPVHPLLLFFALIFLLQSVISLIANLLPRRIRVGTGDPTEYLSDGKQLMMIIRRRRYIAEWMAAMGDYRDKNFDGAATRFEELHRSYPDDRELMRTAIFALLAVERNERGLELSEAYRELFPMEEADLIYAGAMKVQMERFEESLIDFDEALALNERSSLAWNNRGYACLQLGRFDEAIDNCDRSIELCDESDKATLAYAHNNRGMARIKLGMDEEGLRDIERSLEIDPTNSYAYLNRGIYHFDKGEHREALPLFEKAKEMNPKTRGGLDDYLSNTHAFLRSQPETAPMPA